MPYIQQDSRAIFDAEIDNLYAPTNPGDLNYIITQICLKYLKERGTNYQRINDVVGCLDCAKMEFYAKLARPYEEEKIKLNGGLKQYEN